MHVQATDGTVIQFCLRTAWTEDSLDHVSNYWLNLLEQHILGNNPQSLVDRSNRYVIKAKLAERTRQIVDSKIFELAERGRMKCEDFDISNDFSGALPSHAGSAQRTLDFRHVDVAHSMSMGTRGVYQRGKG